MDTGRLRRRRFPKVTTETPEPQVAEVSEQTTPEFLDRIDNPENFNTVSRINREEGEDMTLTFSGGNISEERLEELTLPSDTTASLLIKRFENFNPVANWDVRQNTNGFGTEALNANEEVTMEVAQERLMDVITRDTNSIKNFDEEHGYNFTDSEVAALTSFMFNLGPRSLNQVTDNGTRSKEEIANKMLEYINSAGQPLQGLIKRRQDEYDIFTGKVTI